MNKGKCLHVGLFLIGCILMGSDLSYALTTAQKTEVDEFVTMVGNIVQAKMARIVAADKIADEVAPIFPSLTVPASTATTIGDGFDAQLTALQEVIAGDFGKFAVVKAFFEGKGLFVED